MSLFNPMSYNISLIYRVIEKRQDVNLSYNKLYQYLLNLIALFNITIPTKGLNVSNRPLSSSFGTRNNMVLS